MYSPIYNPLSFMMHNYCNDAVISRRHCLKKFDVVESQVYQHILKVILADTDFLVWILTFQLIFSDTQNIINNWLLTQIQYNTKTDSNISKMYFKDLLLGSRYRIFSSIINGLIYAFIKSNKKWLLLLLHKARPCCNSCRTVTSLSPPGVSSAFCVSFSWFSCLWIIVY